MSDNTTTECQPRTLADLAREAIAVQNACNLSGVAQGFARAMIDLCRLVPGTNERNRHPIALIWSDKISSLTGQGDVDRPGEVVAAYTAVYKLAE